MPLAYYLAVELPMLQRMLQRLNPTPQDDDEIIVILPDWMDE